MTDSELDRLIVVCFIEALLIQQSRGFIISTSCHRLYLVSQAISASWIPSFMKFATESVIGGEQDPPPFKATQFVEMLLWSGETEEYSNNAT